MKKNKKSHDFLSLELYEFSNITLKEEVFPILVHIKDIKWFDFSYTIKKEGNIELHFWWYSSALHSFLYINIIVILLLHQLQQI